MDTENVMFIKKTRSDKIFDFFNIAILIFVLAIVLYPLYLVLIASISDPVLVLRGEVLFYPKGISFGAYETIMANTQLWRSYLNSIIYTVAGAFISIIITMMAAYSTSHNFIGKKVVNLIIVFTMFFSGGLIPTFLTMKDLGLYDNPAIMVLMGAVSVWNLMLARTYIISTIPMELYEAATLDGASHFNYFFKVVLPLSGTIVAVLCVYYGIARWNDYFTGLVYLKRREFLPLQTILREILASLQVSRDVIAMSSDSIDGQAEAIRKAEVAKYCIIVVSTLPAVILYLGMQKFFVKGVMVGSLKG